MPLFATFFGSVLAAFASFLVKFVSRKVAVATASLTALATISAALVVFFNTAVSPLVQQLFATQYGQLLGLAFPPVAGTCMAVIGSTWAACGLYAWQLKALQLTTQA
jgi:hypothetical protein